MHWKMLGVIVALAAGLGLVFTPQPSLDSKMHRINADLDSQLDTQEMMIDPAELLDLIHSTRVAVRIFDVRGESDFNLFHIIDSIRISEEHVRDPEWIRNIPQQTVLVLASNDTARAIVFWKYLKAQNVTNLYILDGGINGWISLYHDPQDTTIRSREKGFDDQLGYTFEAALGSRHTASDPDPALIPKREYQKKVKQFGNATRKSGGCG